MFWERMKEFLSKTRHLFIEKAKLYQLIILTKTGGTSVHAEYISLSREQKRSAIKRCGRMNYIKIVHWLSSHYQNSTEPDKTMIRDIMGCIKHIPSYTDGKPIGSIRIKERRQYIKIAPHKWVQLHNHIWEQANGPIPKGHVLIFGDGDFLNTDLDNLILVTRKQLLILNGNNLIKDHADFTKVGVMIADLLVAAKTNKL